MSRRVRLLVFLGFMMVTVFSMGLPAGAAPEDVQVKQAEVGDAQQRLEEIQTEASVSYEAYDSALLGLNDLDDQIASTERDLSEAEDRLAEAQASLEESATQVYKSGNVGFIDVLVGSEDFSEFATRIELWVRLLAQERERFNAVLDAKNEIEAERASLEDRREKRTAALEEAMQEKEQAENAEAEMQSYLDSLSGELQAAMEEEQAREAAAAREAALAAAQAAEEEAKPIETVQVVQVAPRVSQADLQAQREAAEQRAAERAEKRAAAEAAAQEAERQAKLAAREAAAKQAEKREAAEQAAAERRAEAEEARRAAEQAAVEEAAAQRAAELAAQQEAAKQAAEQAAAEQAAAEQQAAEQAAAEQAAQEAAEQEAAEQAAAEQEQTTPAPQTPAPAPAPAPAPGGSAPTTGGGSCGDTFGGVQPHVAEFGCLVRAQFGIQTIYGYRAGDPGDHGSGLALDVMTYSDSALGQQVADFALANMGQYGITYVIFQQRINFGSGWEPMEDRGSPTANHMDHPHISFSPR